MKRCLLKNVLNFELKYWNICRKLFHFSQNKSDLGSCNIIRDLGCVSDENEVPDHIEKPYYYYEFTPPGNTTIGNPEIKTEFQINMLRKSCKLAANILKECQDYIKVGLTTDELDKIIHHRIINSNAYPSPLRYGGFPKSICTSVNNVACHGVPDSRELMDGDIINVDITVYYCGYHGDCSQTFLVGNVDERGKYLVNIARESLFEGIKYCKPNQPLYGIGKNIDSYVKRHKLKIVPSFIGHGIGSYFHGPPEIYHFDNNIGGIMQTGMTFTIEPIVTLGDIELEIQTDGWTAMSMDNSRSAQFEHTVLITNEGVEILTVPD